VQPRHRNAEPVPFGGGVDVVACADPASLLDDLLQAGIQPRPCRGRELLDGLGRAALPQDVERFYRIGEAGVQLVDMCTELGEYGYCVSYQRGDLRVYIDVAEVGG